MFALVLSVLLTQAGAPSAPAKGRLLPVDEVEAGQISFKSGTSVLALCGAELKQVKATIKKVKPREDGIRTGREKEISVPCEASWVFFQVPALAPGPVKTSFEAKLSHPLGGHLPSRTPIAFTLANKQYKVVFESEMQPDFSVFLLDGEKKLPLYIHVPDGKEGDATLLWAGDMNRDNLPDVILMAGGENRSMTLYLSAPGSERPLPAAVYEYSGLD